MAFKPQPLNQSEYSMTIIEDLGNILNEAGTRKARFAIVECTECTTRFQLRMGSTKAKNQTRCVTCATTKHGLTDHPLYAVWNSIRQRCYNPKRKDYDKYGGKGVTMHQDWKDDPTNFIQWCEANGWDSSKEVDKDLGSEELGLEIPTYSPDTIRFMTQEENAGIANNKKVIQYTLEGEYLVTHDSCTKAALALGKSKSSKSSIANCARGLNKTSLGFKWEFA